MCDERKAALKALAEADPYYPQFHISPPYGLLNDPNGLCQKDGEHHIFYQWTPVGAVHGLKYWYHLSTRDFITLVDHGVGIRPGDDYDSHGCYSGSALVEDDKAFLFYTGNKRDEQWQRDATQCLAVMDGKGNIEKHGVVISNEHYTEHFRDPKVWKEGDHYYMVVGAQTSELKGGIALYHSLDMKQWQHKGMIATNYPDFGYMWECPDLFTLDGYTVLLFSPQGVQDDDKYRFNNIYQSGYLLGDRLTKDTPELVNHQAFAELDSGFDFYAPQTYEDEQGRRILIGWIGLPEIDYPTDKNQWAHMLSIPRQLSVENGVVIQQPLSELMAMRMDAAIVSGMVTLESPAFELEFTTSALHFELMIGNEAGDQICLSMNESEFTLDRSKMTECFASEFGEQRFIVRTEQCQNIKLFFDCSVLEVFLNNGRNTMTARVFIRELSFLTLSQGVVGQLFNLKKSRYVKPEGGDK